MNTLLTAKSSQQQNTYSISPGKLTAIYVHGQFTGKSKQTENAAHVASNHYVEMHPALDGRISFLERLTELIQANIDDETYGITELCRDVGASRTQIHNKVKKSTGLSTSKFVRFIKLRKAKVLLLKTDLNITQVAFEVGFRDPHYFSRVFHDSFGMCPRDFRKSQVNFSIN